MGAAGGLWSGAPFRRFASGWGSVLAAGEGSPESRKVQREVILAKKSPKRNRTTAYLYELGKACLRQGSYQEAVNYFEKVLLINPGDKEARSYIVQIKNIMEERGTEIRARVVKEDREVVREIERRRKKEAEQRAKREEQSRLRAQKEEAKLREKEERLN